MSRLVLLALTMVFLFNYSHGENINKNIGNISKNNSELIKVMDIDNLYRKSDIIFYGKVIDVSYKVSKNGMPYTYVSYKINKIIKGLYEGNEITLRFIGGLDEDKELASPVTHVPLFEVKNKDVIFATNESPICSTVTCNYGRLRLNNGKVYSYDGREIIYENNAFIYGDYIDIDDFHEDSMKGKVIVKREIKNKKSLSKSSASSLGSFISYINKMKKKKFNKFISHDINKPIDVNILPRKSNAK